MNNLTILDYYLEQNKNQKYVDEYQSTSDKKSGKTFWHINVNFRSLFSFIDTFNKFIRYDSKDRKDWDVYSNNEQRAKHWTVRMQQSKLFHKDKKSNMYKLTAKGEAFKDFVSMINDPKFYFSDSEKWIIIYNFILNSYFDLKPNYILKKSLNVYNELIASGFSIEYINQKFLELLNKGSDIKREDLFKLDSFWLLTFYKDKDFLELFKESSSIEKNDLFNYVIGCSKMPNDVIKKNNDLISKKFVPGGQYLTSTFIDDVKTLYVSYNLQQINNVDCVSLVSNICSIVSEFDSNVKLSKLVDFINLHRDVFEVIFNEAILNKNIDTEMNTLIDIPGQLDDDSEKEKIDDTTIKNQKQLRKTSQILKRIAKEKNYYHCELEILNSCKYFTSKENNKNYLEIHHLIPFEFSNDFDVTLEVIENYVALCPHCHRLLHFGVDRERKSVLTYLYNQRKEGLKEKGLNISLKDLFAYYDFEEVDTNYDNGKEVCNNDVSNSITYEELLLMIKNFLETSNPTTSTKIANELNLDKTKVEQILIRNSNIFKIDRYSNWSLR